MVEAVVDVVGKDGAGVEAGMALLATTAGVEDVEASAGVADAAHAQTALAEACTARPVCSDFGVNIICSRQKSEQ